MNTEKVIESLKTVAISTVGGSVAYGATKAIPETSKLRKFAGLALIGGGVLAMLSDNDLLQDAGIGISTVGAFDLSGQLLAPRFPESNKIHSFIPKLGELANDDLEAIEANQEYLFVNEDPIFDEYNDDDFDEYEDISGLAEVPAGTAMNLV